MIKKYPGLERQESVSPKPLYSCEKCKMNFNTVQEAFSHDKIQHCHLVASLGNHHGEPTSKSNPQSDPCTVFKCKDCPTLCLNSLVLQVHKFLHQDFTYFFCPDCEYVFGLPSKLKRHSFLSHEKILDSELEHVLDMESRIEITLKIQEYLTNSDPSKVEVVDNFLEASLDAKLILDEIAMNEEVEEIPLKILGQLLNQYLKVEDNHQSYRTDIEEILSIKTEPEI